MIEGVSALSMTKSAAASLGAASTTGAAGATAAPDFGSFLTQTVNNAVGTMQAGEAAAIQGLQGTTPAYKVVESVMAAQRTLQSALAIRDKVVSAFQEITRMSI